jgi:hypothetical protein
MIMLAILRSDYQLFQVEITSMQYWIKAILIQRVIAIQLKK